MERFSGLLMWRSSVSAASDARRALPGEATRLAVVAVRARVVADGLLVGEAAWGLPRMGPRRGAASDGRATDAGLQNRCGAAIDAACAQLEVAISQNFIAVTARC